MTSRSLPVIAIDGPAGAGKSTVARRVAQRLGFQLVDTGALYRGVALVARERDIDWQDGPALGAFAERLVLEFTSDEDGAPRLWVDGRDRAEAIRTSEIARGASDVSRHPEVRAALLERQRELGRDGGVVLEGRDIGTVVFPDAEVKIFLTASPEERARRRHSELETRGVEETYEEILQRIQERDAQDSNRAVAPLRPAPDSIHVDTTSMTIDTVVERIVSQADAVRK